MDRETLNEMVKLKFGARKAGGPEIDLVKLAADARTPMTCSASSRTCRTRRWSCWR